MDEQKIQKTSEELRNKAARKKASEEEKSTKERMKSVISKRDQAIKAIEKYQDETGIPESQEIDGEFLESAETNN